MRWTRTRHSSVAAPCPPRALLQLRLSVQGDDRRAAETEVVLERHLGARYLALPRLAPELPVEFGTLSKAGRPKRVALGNETTRGVHHDFAAVGICARINELPTLALGAEAETLVRDEFVARKAIVQFHHVDILWSETALRVDFLCRLLRHVESDHLDTTLLVEGAPEVGGHRHPGDLHRFALEPVLSHEVFAGENRCACAV